jgi:phospholipid/cholesterol/gamma-HCH transport system substrate-binding protein
MDEPPHQGVSPEARARWLFAGLVLAVALAALGWWGIKEGRYATYEIDTHDAVSGLIASAPVEFHGVEVGKVERVELAGPQSVRILLHVDKGAPVTAATVATITSRGLASKGFTGYVYVALDDDGSDLHPPAARPGSLYPQLRTAPSRSVNLDTAIAQVNQNVQYMANLLQTSLDANTIAQLKQSVDGMQKLTQALTDPKTLAALTQSVDSMQKLTGALSDDKTLASLQQSLDSMQKVTRTLADNSEKLNAIVQNTERATNRLEPLLDSGSNTARALQSQVLPQAYEALANLDRLSASLRATTNRIEQDPSLVIRGTGKRAPGPGESK